MIEDIKSLSEIERKVIAVLASEPISFEIVANKSNTPIDSVRRAAAWLSEKGFAQISEEESIRFFLTKEGEKALREGMPEEIFLSMLKTMGGTATFSDLKRELNKIDENEFNSALGINKKNAFISISNGSISLTGADEEHKAFDFKSALNGIKAGVVLEETAVKELLVRRLVDKKKIIARSIKIIDNGVEAQRVLSQENITREYDVRGEVPRIMMGKRSPYIQFLNQIRSKLVALGFNEMYSPLIVSEFYNFDALFQPQNHPARTWSDTYQLKQPRVGKLPDKKIVDAICAAHEDGGKAKSTGWGYKWDPSIAAKLMPAAHGTAHSARQLINGVELPHKYFAIARCFRPDVLDATHLLEFNQMEGFIIGEELNFKHLLGMLKEFAIEIAGAEKVKFFPDYYPFTEPSVQLSAKHPDMGWIELGGAGMFRPEMLENIGVKGSAIAWGFGIDRLAMFKLGIKDIRYLFAEDLNYLRKASGVLL